MGNLLLASKVCERDGIAIIQKYKSIDSFLESVRRKNQERYRMA